MTAPLIATGLGLDQSTAFDMGTVMMREQLRWLVQALAAVICPNTRSALQAKRVGEEGGPGTARSVD
jgi:hypothetical protein